MHTISLSVFCLRLFIFLKLFLPYVLNILSSFYNAKLDVSTTEKALINMLSNKFVYPGLSVTRSAWLLFRYFVETGICGSDYLLKYQSSKN